MMSFRALFPQVLGVGLGVLGGVVLTHGLFERRMERMLDAKLAAQFSVMRALMVKQVVEVPVAPPSHAHEEELRRIHEQLAALATREPPSDPGRLAPESPSEEQPRPDLPTPAQEEASRQAWQVLDAAISRGRWTEEDARLFHRASRAGPPDRVAELESSLSQAINSGQLRPVFADEGR